MEAFVRDPQNNRDFYPQIEIEVVSIAEMNKLELRCEIQHKSNWSNEALRTSRRSKFMCALVLALRKIPIYGPGGGDAGLGDAGHPSWSVSISPAEAIAARDKFNADKDAKRLFPTKKPEEEEDKGKSSSTDYLTVNHPETSAIHTLNNRKPGLDPVRDDTWNNRDDVSTLGRPSLDVRPSIDEVRGLLHKVSSSGKRKQSAAPSETQSRQAMPPLPIPIIPSPSNFSGSQYAQTPNLRGPTSPSSISTGRIEEVHYQSMAPPPQAQSSVTGLRRVEGDESGVSTPRALSPTGSNNPYRSPSLRSPPPAERHPYKP
jgi:hypothetical protein